MPIDLSKIEYKGEGWSDLKREIWSKVLPNDTVIDVGCKQGWWMQSANRIIDTQVRSKIIRIGIDPVDYGPQRQHNASFDVYLKCAIGTENKKNVKFYTLNEPGCNSLLQPSDLLLETTWENPTTTKREISDVIEVEQRTLNSILNDLNIKSVFYVKTDCQGADLDAIKSLGPHLERVQYLEMELGLEKERPFYYESDCIEEILEEMEKMGFEPIEFSSFPLSPLPEGELVFKRKV